MDYNIEFQKTVENATDKRTIIVFSYEDGWYKKVEALNIMEFTNPDTQYQKEHRFQYSFREYSAFSENPIDIDTLIQSLFDDKYDIDWINP